MAYPKLGRVRSRSRTSVGKLGLRILNPKTLNLGHLEEDYVDELREVL